MKALKLAKPAGLDQIRLVEIDPPAPPKAGEILVRLQASSLNFHDLAVAAGVLPTAEGRIPLSDGAGVVEEVGEGVTAFKVGDLVVSVFFPLWQDGPPLVDNFSLTPGDGLDGYARERVVVPAQWFTHAPKGYSAAQAATLTTAGLTAWRALADGGIKAGDRVLILGTGGVSIFALQFAKMMGATVAATSSSDEKLERVKAMGADHVINYKSVEAWGQAALDWTGGVGFDHVVEVGGPATLPQSITATRLGGQIALIGVLTGVAGPVPTVALMNRQIRLRGLTVGPRRQQVDMIRAIDAAGLLPVIDRHFALEDLAQGLAYLKSGGHFGKIAIDIG